MVNLIFKSSLILKVLVFCLIAKNILSVKGEEIADCAVIREVAELLGSNKTKFSANNCCDLDSVICNAKNVIGIQLIGISCFDFSVKLEAIIDKLATLEHLESFEFSNQSWCDRPNNIPKLKNLKTLIMSHNNYKDTLPEYVIQFTKLEKLDLSFNKYFYTIPSSYRRLRNLKSLILNNNNLSGSIPYSLIRLENLTELNLAENKELTGYVPDIPKINVCNYANTGLCSLNSTTCATNLETTCTEDIITKTNKNNGKETFDSNENLDEPRVDITDKFYDDDGGNSFFPSIKNIIIVILVILFIGILSTICFFCSRICKNGGNVNYNKSYNNTSSGTNFQTVSNFNNNNNNNQQTEHNNTSLNDLRTAINQALINNNNNNSSSNNNNNVHFTVTVTDTSNNNTNNNNNEEEEEEGKEQEGRLLMNNNESNEKPNNIISESNNNQPSSSNNNTSGSAMTTSPTYAPIPNIDPNLTSAVNLPYAAYPVPVQYYPLPNQSYPSPPPPQGYTPQGYPSYPQYYQPVFVQGYPATETSKVNNSQNNLQDTPPAYQNVNGYNTATNEKEKSNEN